MSTQTAVEATALGKPLTVNRNRPIPQPGHKQVLLRVTIAGPNPHDHKARDTGLFIKDKLPAVLTNDVVGIVTKLGPSASKFKVGDAIFTQANFDGEYAQNGFQQYSVADEDFASLIPTGFSQDDVATLPTNIIPALVAYFDSQNGFGIPAPWTEEAKTFDYKSKKLLVVGGGSSCGKFGVQLAVLAGIRNITVVGGPEAELKKLGATQVLDRHGGYDAVLQRIRSVVGDDLDYSFDTINPPDGQYLAIDALSNTKKGKFARLLPRPLDESKIPRKSGGLEIKEVFGSSHAKPDIAKPFWDRLAGYLTEGKVVPTKYEVVKGLDVDKINELLDRYRDSKSVVKTHFHISA